MSPMLSSPSTLRRWSIESKNSRGKGGEVVDEFLDTHEVGHEPADVQAEVNISSYPA